jgi:hypothetical protein
LTDWINGKCLAEAIAIDCIKAAGSQADADVIADWKAKPATFRWTPEHLSGELPAVPTRVSGGQSLNR